MEKEDRKSKAVWVIGILSGIATIVALCIAILAFNLDIVSFFSNMLGGIVQEKNQQDVISLQQTSVVLQATSVYSQEQSNKIQVQIKELQETALVPDFAGTQVVEKIASFQSTQTILDDTLQSVQATLTAMPQIASENITEIPSTQVDTTLPRANVGEQTTPLSFSSSTDINTLSSDWTVYSGKSDANSVRLSDDGATLTLIAGPKTSIDNGNDTAPYVSFPLDGNFMIQIKAYFNPEEKYQVIGFGLKPRDKEGQWISVRKYSESPGAKYIDLIETQNNSTRQITRRIPYIKDNIFFRIQRNNELISFWTSENGENWFPIQTDYVFSLPEGLYAFLYTWSSSMTGTLAQFSEFELVDNPSSIVQSHSGTLTFSDILSPNSLNPLFGWFPGGSYSNSYNISNSQLNLICGPDTSNQNGNASAPTVILPVSGNFETQVKLEFNPRERHQLAGFGISQDIDNRKWVMIRRWSDSPNGQYLGIEQTDNYSSREISRIDSTDTSLYLKIIRSEPLVSFYYSSDGLEWIPLSEDFVMSFPQNIFLNMYCWSTSNNGIMSRFSDLSVISK